MGHTPPPRVLTDYSVAELEKRLRHRRSRFARRRRSAHEAALALTRLRLADLGLGPRVGPRPPPKPDTGRTVR